MNTVQGITQDYFQKLTLVLSTGKKFDLTIRYVPQQLGWYLQNLTYESFTIMNRRITTSPNMLQQYRNQVPFGLACLTRDNGEPTQLQDFTSGYATLYVLTSGEVMKYSGILSGQI